MSLTSRGYIPRKSSSNNSPIQKGATEALKIDKNEIERVLHDLRKNSDLLVEQLEPKMATHLKLIVDYAKKFHKTSSYNDFYEQILKYFSNVKNILPGTVASTLIGNYYYKGDFESKVYAPTCIGSIPSPDDQELPPCDRNVVVVYRDKTSDKSIANTITKVPTTNKKDIVVLMGDISSRDTTLYDNEHKLLASMNVVNYDLFLYQGGYYRLLKRLYTPMRHNVAKERSTNNYGDAVYVFIAVFVLIILAMAILIK
jgi:hypothetical protein